MKNLSFRFYRHAYLATTLFACAINGCGGISTSNEKTQTEAFLAPASSFSAAAVAAAAARCEQPHGTVDRPTDVAEFKARFLKAWLLCNPTAEPNIFGQSAGIQVTPDGVLHKLGSDGAGGLVRLPGLDGQFEYTLMPNGLMGPALPLRYMYVSPGFFVELEANPTRIQTTQSGGGTRWFVAIE
jgi:hypothetical protein